MANDQVTEYKVMRGGFPSDRPTKLPESASCAYPAQASLQMTLPIWSLSSDRSSWIDGANRLIE